MGNCQDPYQQLDQIQRDHYIQQSQILIDRSHRKITPTKHQQNIGYLLNQHDVDMFNSQKMHKSMALNLNKKLSKTNIKQKSLKIDYGKLQLLDQTFYHSLGLPQYTFQQRSIQNQSSGSALFMMDACDSFGVKYTGQRNSSNKFHGNGILRANTIHYIGQFQNGLKHSHGRQIYTHQVYQGGFSDDRRKGQGKLWTINYVDEGLFDKFFIRGKRTWGNGNQYYGTLDADQMHFEQHNKRSHLVGSHLNRINQQYNNMQCYFIDFQNKLYYQNVVFQHGQLKSAKQVYQIKIFDEKNQNDNKKNGNNSSVIINGLKFLKISIGPYINDKITVSKQLQNGQFSINSRKTQQQIQKAINEWQ